MQWVGRRKDIEKEAEEKASVNWEETSVNVCFKPAFTISGPLFFYIFLRISLSSSLINPVGILIGIALIFLSPPLLAQIVAMPLKWSLCFLLCSSTSQVMLLRCEKNYIISLFKIFHLHPNSKPLCALQIPCIGAHCLFDLIAYCTLPFFLLPRHVVLFAVPQIFLACS